SPSRLQRLAGARKNERLLHVAETRAILEHAYPERIVFEARLILIVSGLQSLASPQHHRRVIKGISPPRIIHDFVVVERHLLEAYAVFMRGVGKFDKRRAERIDFGIVADIFQLLLESVGRADIVAVKARDPLVAACFQGDRERRTQAYAMFRLDGSDREESRIAVQYLLQSCRRTSIHNNDDVIGADCVFKYTMQAQP